MTSRFYIISLILWAALSGSAQALESGHEIASSLEALAVAKPDAHRSLADGTYDTLSPSERIEFVLRLVEPERLSEESLRLLDQYKELDPEHHVSINLLALAALRTINLETQLNQLDPDRVPDTTSVLDADLASRQAGNEYRMSIERVWREWKRALPDPQITAP